MQQYKNDSRQKVQFEIRNMFTSGNRVTYGRVTTFCPVLMEEDFINTVEKMAVTAEKIADAINKVRCVYQSWHRMSPATSVYGFRHLASESHPAESPF